MKLVYSSLAVVLTVLLIQCGEPDVQQPPVDPYKHSSGIATISTDSQTVENLVVLGRVWGFLKYYHPVVATGKYQWDYELFKVMPRIIAAKSKLERNSVLSEWIDSLGTFHQQDSLPIVDSANVAQWPDYSWINEQSLGFDLSNQLNLIKTAERAKKNCYVSLNPGVRNANFSKEEGYDSLVNPDVGYRMLCLFRYWNMIEYFYPNKHLIDKPWTNVLREYVVKFAHCNSEFDYERTVVQMLGEIQDAHAEVAGNIEECEKYFGLNKPVVTLAIIDGVPVVVGVYSMKDEIESNLMKGDIIDSINGKPIDSVFSLWHDYIRGSNEASWWRNMASRILLTSDTSISLVVDRNGEKLSVSEKCYSKSARELRFAKAGTGDDSAISVVQYGIMCIDAGEVKVDQINKFYGFMSCKGLIIDCRNYPTDNLQGVFSDLLYPHSIPFAKYSSTDPLTPGLFTFTKPDYRGFDNPQSYQGKVVVLVNEQTQSAAEFNTMIIRAAPNVVVMGSATAGADGNVSAIKLPGGIQTYISGIGVYYPDGRETQRIGIVPDIEVRPTIKGIREGKDEVMEAAIEFINR